jgi:hypothetical protein
VPWGAAGEAGRSRPPVFARDGHLHAAAEHADVSDDDAIARLEAIGDLRDAALLVHRAQLHRRDVERLPVDAIHEGLAVFLCLA